MNKQEMQGISYQDAMTRRECVELVAAVLSLAGFGESFFTIATTPLKGAENTSRICGGLGAGFVGLFGYSASVVSNSQSGESSKNSPVTPRVDPPSAREDR